MHLKTVGILARSESQELCNKSRAWVWFMSNSRCTIVNCTKHCAYVSADMQTCIRQQQFWLNSNVICITSFFQYISLDSWIMWSSAQCVMLPQPVVSSVWCVQIQLFRENKKWNMIHSTECPPSFAIPFSLIFLLAYILCVYNFSISLNWPPRWSSGQHVWLLITRSRVRSPTLPQILNLD